MYVEGHQTLEYLQGLAQTIPEKRIWRRFRAVILAKQGRTAADSAQSLGCSRRAVKNWVAQYNRGGVAALRERPHPGRPRRLAPDQYPRLKERLDAPPRPEDGVGTLRGLDVQRILEQEFGAVLGLQAVYDLLHRPNYSSLMPRPRHAQANPEVQEFFKEIVVERVEAIRDAHPAEEVRLYFEDEARFGQQGTITRVWAPKGSRPRRVRQAGYTFLFVLVAVRASTGEASPLIMPALNAEVLNLFLGQFSRELPAGVHV